MVTIKALLEELSEGTIASRVAIPHDEARNSFPLRQNTVSSYEEFREITADYVRHHFGRCVAPGARLSQDDAQGRVREILDRHNRRRQGNIVSAFRDASEGTNGGLRVVLDIIADALKAESTERYILAVFDRHVLPHAWEDKVELIRQFFQRCGHDLGPSVQLDQPERYASNYAELVQAYFNALQQGAQSFRRL